MTARPTRRSRAVTAGVALTTAMATGVTVLAGTAAGAAPTDPPPAGGTAAATATTDTTTAGPLVYPYDRTTPLEAARVDGVPTPDLGWFDCAELFAPRARCGVAELPLDYDEPSGEQVEVAVLKIPAKNQRDKIGTLFVNPGGPGGSGVGIASAAQWFLSPTLLDKFDVVGFDPRGTNFSTNVKCFKNLGEYIDVLGGMQVAFPVKTTEIAAYLESSAKAGRACSTTGTPLSGSMSTAEVARDMDVLRRAVGDTQLTYLGFSYGSYLGTVYANLFPDRVRALVIDGVLDPVAWAGTPATTSIPQTQRLRSGEAAARALNEALHLCKVAGKERCYLAEKGDPKTVYRNVAASLKKKSVVLKDDESGEVLARITYALFVSVLLSDLYDQFGAEYATSDIGFVYDLQHPSSTAAGQKVQLRAQRALLSRLRQLERAQGAVAAQQAKASTVFPAGAFDYPNDFDAFQTVLCTDGSNPRFVTAWETAARRADQGAPGFGPLWTWSSAPCASETWTVRDEDAYTGPFDRRTSTYVLVVGSYWDPATSYDGAVAAASLLPKSRLLSSDNWGHTAYGTGACATLVIDRYLLARKVPQAGKVCTAAFQAFEPWDAEGARATGTLRPLPPVVPPLRGAVPRVALTR